MKARYSTALALPLATLIACGGGGGSTDIEGTVTFSALTDPEISRFISAVGGSEMFQAESAADQFGDTFDLDPACPTITVDGDTVTVVGGCTNVDGVTIDGTVIAHNPTSWDQVDYDGGDSLYEMQGLVITQNGFSMSYDGFVSRGDNFQTWDADVTVSQLGAAMRSDLYVHCSTSGTCSISGSGLELIGVGGATASGKIHVDLEDFTQTSDFTLHGTDTLEVHINEQNCIQWSIEGTDRGTVCAP
jgi:hypothetical protein